MVRDLLDAQVAQLLQDQNGAVLGREQRERLSHGDHLRGRHGINRLGDGDLRCRAASRRQSPPVAHAAAVGHRANPRLGVVVLDQTLPALPGADIGFLERIGCLLPIEGDDGELLQQAGSRAATVIPVEVKRWVSARPIPRLAPVTTASRFDT